MTDQSTAPAATPLETERAAWRGHARRWEARAKAAARDNEQLRTDRDLWRGRAQANLAVIFELRQLNRDLLDRLGEQPVTETRR